MKISQIKPNPDNPRVITDSNFKKLVQSLKDFPVMTELREVLLDENNMIIGGNMRYKAAKEAGWSEIPTKVFTREDAKRNNELTGQNKTYEEYVEELIVKDNIFGGEWDWDLLSTQHDPEVLDSWGLDVPDWDDNKEVEEDEAPEVSSEPPVSQLGVIYQLGRHRVMCGDSTDFNQVMTLFDDKQADMIFTDPPYNVNYQSAAGNGYSEGKFKHEKIFNDNKSDEEFTQFLKDVASAWDSVLKDNSPVYVWHGDSSYNAVPFYEMFKSAGWYRASTLCWVKESQTMTWQHYKPKHEVCSYGWKGKKVDFKKNDETTIWELSRDKTTEYNHPTQKPVGLALRAINNHDIKLVAEAFLGSGSTLIACEQTDRTCYGMELAPEYVDVIRKRYAKFIDPENWEEKWETMTPAIN